MDTHRLLPAPYRTPDRPAEPRRWPATLARVLDDYGLDAILGFLFPVAGDAVTGFAALSLLAHAISERVPTVILMRIVLNVGLDTLIGFIPVVGDVFDIFFRANRRNLALIEKHRGGQEEPSNADYAIVLGGVLLIVLGIATPFLVLGALGYHLSQLFG